MRTKGAARMERTTGFALLAVFTGILLSYLAYYAQQFASSGLNPIQLISSLLFWCGLLGLIFRYPLNGIVREIGTFFRSVLGFLTYVTYMSFHLILYGFILEGIVSSVSPVFYSFPVRASFAVSSSMLYPATFQNAVLGLFVFPDISLTIPPILEASLSLFSIAMAVIIGLLVEANIMKSIELKAACSRRKKSMTFFVLPVIGVVGGASCCLSLPIFIALLASPATALASPSILLGYYATYFLFPPGTAVALKLNLNSMNNIATKIASHSVPREQMTKGS